MINEFSTGTATTDGESSDLFHALSDDILQILSVKSFDELLDFVLLNFGSDFLEESFDVVLS